jgi:hypothetical protein
MSALLDEGELAFGVAARDRYAALIVQVMQDVADNPRRPGPSQNRRSIRPCCSATSGGADHRVHGANGTGW